jgi:hypothetical protein
LNPYGKENRTISLFIIMPLFFVGLFLSVNAIRKQLILEKAGLNINIVLASLMLFYAIWFLWQLLL